MDYFKVRSYFEISDQQGEPHEYLRAPYWWSFFFTISAVVLLQVAWAVPSIAVFVASIVSFFIGLGCWFELRSRVERIQANQRKASDLRDEQASRTLVEIKDKMSKMRGSSIRTGDIIVNAPDAAIVVGSGAIDIARGVQARNPELAQAITEIMGYIENSKNKEAAQTFEEFLKESEKNTPNKTVLRALWDATISAAPALKDLSEAVAILREAFL